MQNKLQELTDRLYSEGLSKGKEDGARILEDARKKADEIIAGAKAEAESILAEAESKAAALREKAESDVRTASAQALQATKSDIERLLVSEISAKPVGEALSDPEFLKDIIKTVAVRFSATEPVDMALIVPEALKDRLEPWVSSELARAVSGGVSASFSKKVAGGFKIGPSDGSWYVSLTDETFKALIAEYLRPVTKKLLFGE